MMWNLWQKAKTYHLLPSEIFGEDNSLAAWMLDSAVTWFGITIENALSERVKVGVGANAESRPKYTLARLLDQDFKLPRPADSAEIASGTNVWSPLLSWAGRKNSGVKWWKYNKPVD
jgi:hypothetical protein